MWVFIYNYIYFKRLDDSVMGYWIGLSDQDTEGHFIWTNGEETNYTNWYEGEPNDYEHVEDCANFVYWSFFWYDTTCSHELKSVCESK